MKEFCRAKENKAWTRVKANMAYLATLYHRRKETNIGTRRSPATTMVFRRNTKHIIMRKIGSDTMLIAPQ